MSTTTDFLLSIQSQTFRAKALELTRIKALLKLLGDPQHQLKAIHVAGTNGKGSVCATLFSCLRVAGYKVGLYTSPHLMSHAERFQMGDENSSWTMKEFEFLALAEKVRVVLLENAVLDDNYPTWFELLTVIGFLHFVSQQVDWLVLEVGLGGRFDATNVKDWEYKVITNIALEHTKELGNTIALIAAEKAAIIHANNPWPGKIRVVTATEDDAWQVVSKRCQETNTGCWKRNRDYSPEFLSLDLTSTHYLYRNLVGSMGSKFRTALLGEHQVENTSCAVAVLDLMVQNGDIMITPEQDQLGMAQTIWPGRMEFVSAWPKANGQLILDGGHNPAGVETLTQTLKYFKTRQLISPSAKINVVFAAKQDKKVDQMLALLEPVTDHFVFCPIHALVHSYSPVDLVKLVSKSSTKAISCAEAIEYLKTISGPDDLNVICGSLYFIGEAKKEMDKPALWAFDEMQYNMDARR